jgi:hypothetical protein
MYYVLINSKNLELKELFPEGIPSFGPTPDDFIEIYDESTFELLDIQPAFRVNVKGLTTQQELRLFNFYAATADDPQMVIDSFKLLESGWVTIPVEEVQSVIWREGEKVFAFTGDLSVAIAT